MTVAVPTSQRFDLLDPAEVSRLGGIEIVAEGVVEGFLTGLHRSPFRGFSVEFTEHRPYQPPSRLKFANQIHRGGGPPTSSSSRQPPALVAA